MRPAGRESAVEWCDRRLLQRIHRATLGRLRRDVEPLSAQDLMRFFFRWQRVDAISKLRGPLGVAKAVELLQGYDAPAAAWEEELLPSRVHHYQGEYLERACYSGDVAWGRLHLRTPASAGPRRGALVVPARAFPLPKGTVAVEPVAPATPPKKANFVSRNASLTFVRRADMEWLLEAARPESRLADGPPPWPEHLSQAALDVARALEKRGASFFAELTAATKRLPAEVEDALWELLSQGLVTADAVQNLRVLQSPKLRRRQRAMMRGGPGRWTLLRPVGQSAEDELLEKVALLFLKRWGIVFRDIAVKEPLCPPWRELLFVYRRMEARGEVRGGRFVSGFAGEQFALPEAVETARAIRKAPKTGETIRISATDPLNLTGIVTPGVRVPSVMGHEVTFVDGVPQAKAVAEVFASDERDQDSPPN